MLCRVAHWFQLTPKRPPIFSHVASSWPRIAPVVAMEEIFPFHVSVTQVVILKPLLFPGEAQPTGGERRVVDVDVKVGRVVQDAVDGGLAGRNAALQAHGANVQVDKHAARGARDTLRGEGKKKKNEQEKGRTLQHTNKMIRVDYKQCGCARPSGSGPGWQCPKCDSGSERINRPHTSFFPSSLEGAGAGRGTPSTAPTRVKHTRSMPR
mgnify:CR=1 FL=1